MPFDSIAGLTTARKILLLVVDTMGHTVGGIMP